MISFLKKYKPKNIDDMIYNDKFKLIIKGLIDMDYLNILLIGNQGCGKTTLLQGVLYNYYGELDYSENVLYITNLKEQGISYFRQNVKTFCQTKSNLAFKKKTILLDDCDIINEQSQQIIRSCIDNYSYNVNFIASCSNINKVLDCLQSRMNIFKIAHIDNSQLLSILQKIKLRENLNITLEAQEFLIKISDFSIKILITNLEKISLLGKQDITLPMVKKVCSNICYDKFYTYTQYWLFEKDLPKAINEIKKLYLVGYSLVDILENYFFYVKITTQLTDDMKFKILPYICKYITILQTIHENVIELNLFTFDLFKNIK